MVTVFWYTRSTLLVDFLPHRQMVNAVRYSETLNRLRIVVHKKIQVVCIMVLSFSISNDRKMDPVIW